MEISEIERLVCDHLSKEGLSQPRIDALARQVLLSAQAKAAPRSYVLGFSRGVLKAALLSEASLEDAASSALAAVAEIGQGAGFDPAEILPWTLQGIAEIARVAPGSPRRTLSERLEQRFMGAGEMFEAFFDKSAD